MAIPASVVGTGFGARVHVPALRAAGFAIMGLVGRNAERLARKAAHLSIPASFTDLDEAITRTGAQAISIATPPVTHAGLARTAMARLRLPGLGGHHWRSRGRRGQLDRDPRRLLRGFFCNSATHWCRLAADPLPPFARLAVVGRYEARNLRHRRALMQAHLPN